MPGWSDAYTNLWSYWWVNHSVTAWQSIYNCTWVWPPYGADLTYHATSILPAILTAPIAWLFGTVSGFNSMILLMLLGSAWMYYYFLVKTFDTNRLIAFLVGALFGLCPFFVFKTSAHTTLIGGVFWGGCLASLLYSYIKQQFTIRQGILFGVLFWATFWTSFVEFFMLTISIGVIIAIFELLMYKGKEVKQKLLWCVPAILLSIPAILVILSHPTNNATLLRVVYPAVNLSDLFLNFPWLGAFQNLHLVKLSSEYGGTYLPWTVLGLGALGIASLFQKTIIANRLYVTIGSISFLLLLITIDIGGIPSAVLRAVPMGSGFRVFSRFFPLFLFFFLMFTTLGLSYIAKTPIKNMRRIIIGLVCSLLLVEYMPTSLHVKEVKHFTVPDDFPLDSSKYICVIPEGPYYHIHDTYQATMDKKFVNLMYITREDPKITTERKSNFPMIYGRQNGSKDEFIKELRQLNVGYLLFESEVTAYKFPIRGPVIATDKGQALMDITFSLDSTLIVK